MDWCLVDLLLHHAPHFVIDQIQIYRLFGGHNVGGIKSDVWDRRILDNAVSQWCQRLSACVQAEGGHLNLFLE